MDRPKVIISTFGHCNFCDYAAIFTPYLVCFSRQNHPTDKFSHSSPRTLSTLPEDFKVRMNKTLISMACQSQQHSNDQARFGTLFNLTVDFPPVSKIMRRTRITCLQESSVVLRIILNNCGYSQTVKKEMRMQS